MSPLNDEDVKRDKRSPSVVQMMTEMVFCPKRSRGGFQEFLFGVYAHIVCGCTCNMLMSWVGGKCQAHIRASDGRNQSPPGP